MINKRNIWPRFAGVDSEAYDRQLNLEERYQNLAAERLQLVSLDLESKAEALARSRDYANASAKYREALEQQKQINETFPLARLTTWGARLGCSGKPVTLLQNRCFSAA